MLDKVLDLVTRCLDLFRLDLRGNLVKVGVVGEALSASLAYDSVSPNSMAITSQK